MRYLGFYILFSLLVFECADAQAQVAKMNEVVSLKVALKEMLQQQGAASLKKLSVNVDAERAEQLRQEGVSASGSYTVYQGLDAGGAVIGTVVIVNERGKEGPLQLLVALDPEGMIYDVGFTVFGEDKGKPASAWPFLSQFMQKKASDSFRLGDGVDGVSGATWTSESVSSAIHRGVALYTMFFVNA